MSQENVPPSASNPSTIVPETSALMRMAQSEGPVTTNPRKNDVSNQTLYNKRAARNPIRPRAIQPRVNKPSSPGRPSRVLAPIPSVANEQPTTTQTIQTPHATIHIDNGPPANVIPLQDSSDPPSSSPPSTPGTPELIAWQAIYQAHLAASRRTLQPRFDPSMSSDMDDVLEPALNASLKRPALSADLEGLPVPKRMLSGSSCSSGTSTGEMDEVRRKQLENEIWGDYDDLDVAEAAAAFERELAAAGESPEDKKDFRRLIHSIPLDEAPNDEVDLSETVLVRSLLPTILMLGRTVLGLRHE